jgi:hypothetical protein
MGMGYSPSPDGELSGELTLSDLQLYPPSLDGGLSGESTLSALRVGAIFGWGPCSRSLEVLVQGGA